MEKIMPKNMTIITSEATKKDLEFIHEIENAYAKYDTGGIITFFSSDQNDGLNLVIAASNPDPEKVLLMLKLAIENMEEQVKSSKEGLNKEEKTND